MTDPSALARGRIQTLEEESLPAGGPPDSSMEPQGPRAPEGGRAKPRAAPASSIGKLPIWSGPSPILLLQSSEAGLRPWQGAWTPTW